MSSKSEELKQEASKLIKNSKKISEYAELLACGTRRERQKAAAVLAVVSEEKPELLVPYAKDLIDALNRPEAQTRWEVLDALTNMIDCDARQCEKALGGAETALFDEDSGPLRLSAMKFLCRYGATTENRSEKAWPLIDEGIQCYHGDVEFQDMLLAVIDFSAGKISKQVKEELAARMLFDAENGKGTLKLRATKIVENAKA